MDVVVDRRVMVVHRADMADLRVLVVLSVVKVDVVVADTAVRGTIGT